MEFKEKKNHYLHPDFEDVDVKNQNKPSPLALLAQTCKNIGSKDAKDFVNCEKLFTPNSTINGFRKILKRCRSDCSSSSSSLDKEYICNAKSRYSGKGNSNKKCKIDILETKNTDSSSEASFNSTSSLLTSLLHFVKGSNKSQSLTSEKMDLSQFVNSYDEKDQYIDLSKPKDFSIKRNHFNVSKAYHLESAEDTNHPHFVHNTDNHSPSKFQEKSPSSSSDYTPTTSSIKYCMYCGKLIPVLPVLLAHIRLEHGPSNYSEPTPDNSFNSSGPNIYDIFSKFNPNLTSSPTKSNQPFSFLSDYLSSSFHGLNNLIC